MYYVNFFEEYPIYEPAEGGYYYAGSKNVKVYQFNTWRKARQFYNKCFKNFMIENEIEKHFNGYFNEFFTFDGETVNFCFYGCCSKYCETYIQVFSRYIGGNYGICITKGKPREEIGYTPYC